MEQKVNNLHCKISLWHHHLSVIIMKTFFFFGVLAIARHVLSDSHVSFHI